MYTYLYVLVSIWIYYSTMYFFVLIYIPQIARVSDAASAKYTKKLYQHANTWGS